MAAPVDSPTDSTGGSRFPTPSPVFTLCGYFDDGRLFSVSDASFYRWGEANSEIASGFSSQCMDVQGSARKLSNPGHSCWCGRTIYQQSEGSAGEKWRYVHRTFDCTALGASRCYCLALWFTDSQSLCTFTSSPRPHFALYLATKTSTESQGWNSPYPQAWVCVENHMAGQDTIIGRIMDPQDLIKFQGHSSHFTERGWE